VCAASLGRAEEIDAVAVVRAIEQVMVDVVARRERSVVSVTRGGTGTVEIPDPFRPFARRPPRDQPIDLSALPETFGSGVVIASESGGDDRFVLTNDHVLRGGAAGTVLPVRDAVLVQLADRRVVPAAIIAADPRSDLAVLRLDLAGHRIDPLEVPTVPLGDGGALRKGQFVLALGNPYAIARDGSASVSWGMISNVSRRPAAEVSGDSPEAEGTLIHQFGTLLHVDTRLDLGTSGGALLNFEGELIGLTTSLAALRGYEKSVGFAIPIDAGTRRIIQSLLQGLEVEYGFLGLQPGDVSSDELRLVTGSGAQVSAARAMFVSRDSPAERAGIEPDDLILKINGREILDAADLMRVVGLMGPEATARVELWRPSKRRALSAEVLLGKWPVLDDDQIMATQRRHAAWRGVHVDYPTARRRFLTSDVLERYHRAVLVLEVDPDSVSAAAGLRVGDFITHVGETPVETPRQFHEATGRLSGPVSVIRLDGSRLEIPAP
jgi:serine protease Do